MDGAGSPAEVRVGSGHDSSTAVSVTRASICEIRSGTEKMGTVTVLESREARFFETRVRMRYTRISPRCARIDRKSTRLNSSHLVISYAVFCLKKKKKRQSNKMNLITTRTSIEP